MSWQNLHFVFHFLDSSADPLLDEHFRRSLGSNYKSLFKNSNEEKKSPEPMETNQVTSSTSMTSPVANIFKNEVKEEKSPREEDQERKAVATSSTTAPGPVFQEAMDMEGCSGETFGNTI